MHLLEAITAAIVDLSDGAAHMSAPRAQQIASYVMRASVDHGMDPFVVVAVMRKESGFRPWAVGAAGEIGLMQLLPRSYPDVDPVTLHDQRENIRLGVAHLASNRATCATRCRYKIAIESFPADRWAGRYAGGGCPVKRGTKLWRYLKRAERWRAVVA